MDHRTLDAQRRKHPAWRLLKAEHAPLIASFLHEAFIAPNVRTLSQPELTARLDDALYRLRRELGDEAYPRSARAYLDDWASDDSGWLRKYYPPQSDEPHFDITPSTEKAIEWLASLAEQRFVGTESRLLTVFELLRALVEGAEHDPERRIARLEERRAEIDAEIARVQAGRIEVLGATGVKERFLHMAATARGLLADFREVEQNFRDLDRTVRERIATWEGSKSGLLDAIFHERDAIADSDQGQSFRAFWDFLMSQARQEELTELLAAAFDMAPVKELEPDRRLLRVHYDWLEAGEATQRTVARLSEQLRRYLDDQAWLENRRIMELIRNIEQTALDLRERPPDGFAMELDEPAPAILLPMDRLLFSPPLASVVQDQMPGDDPEFVPADALFSHEHVDKAKLEANIRRALQTRSQVCLSELVEECPIEQGLAELVAYLSLASEDETALIDDARCETLMWTDRVTGSMRQATLPLVIYSRARIAASTPEQA
jgi:flagellar motility protein MotE (MotC chaperone)